MKNFESYKNNLPYPSSIDFTTVFWYRAGRAVATQEGTAAIVSLTNSTPDFTSCVVEKIVNQQKLKEARDAYGAETARLTEVFRQDLFEDLGITNHPMRDKLFSKAWEDGRAHGFSEVYHCACNLIDLIELPKGSILITPADILLENVGRSGQVQIYELAEELQGMLK